MQKISSAAALAKNSHSASSCACRETSLGIANCSKRIIGGCCADISGELLEISTRLSCVVSCVILSSFDENRDEKHRMGEYPHKRGKG